MLTLFKNKNFLALFLGRLITNAGDSLYTVAAMWLVYELGGSAFYTGLAGFLTLLPQSLQFLAGPLVDRWPLRKILVISQSLQCLLILVIPIAHFLGILNVVLVLTIMPIITLIGQIAYPAQSAALPKILTKQQLVKGNSAFSFAYQGVDLTFNALAGILVGLLGAISLYIIDSITFLIATLLFFTIKLPEKEKQAESKEKKKLRQSIQKYGGEIKEGFQFIKGTILPKLIIGSIIANGAIGATLAVLPVVGDSFGGSHIYGYYLAALSAGSLIGALSASFMERFPLGKLSIISFFLGSISWVIGALMPWPVLSIVLFGLAWVPIGGTNVLFGAAMQAMIPERLLGRIFSLLMSINTIAMPIGALLGGALTELYGSTVVFACTGLTIAITPIITLLTPRLRRLPVVSMLDSKTLGFEKFEENTGATTEAL